MEEVYVLEILLALNSISALLSSLCVFNQFLNNFESLESVNFAPITCSELTSSLGLYLKHHLRTELKIKLTSKTSLS